jgi:hypothetical protein
MADLQNDEPIAVYRKAEDGKFFLPAGTKHGLIKLAFYEILE